MVMLAGSGTPQSVVLATAVTSVVIGVLQNEPAENEAAVVRVLGTTKVIAGTSISEGALVGWMTGSKADTADADKDFVLGYALEAAAADGDIIEVLIDKCKASI